MREEIRLGLDEYLTIDALDRMIELTGRDELSLAVEDFKKANVSPPVRDPFSISLSRVFLSYHSAWQSNGYRRWRFEKSGEGSSSLTEDEFIGLYGPMPWRLLDSVLGIMRLPYTFVPPMDDATTVPYEPKLVNAAGTELGLGDLSSGERVLLAIAVSVFLDGSIRNIARIPKLLLLDEADASLHPSMVKTLLSMIDEILVQRNGIRVIMTTHSPSTVALAPPDSLFSMSDVAPRVVKTNVDRAVKALTEGVSTLSVSIENRRQVFVESYKDQDVYQRYFPILKSLIPSDVSLEFIATGNHGTTGGCVPVLGLVKDLTNAGVKSVRGLIDRDKRTGSPINVYYVADRYSIENIVLDPLQLGVLVIRDRIFRPDEIGLGAEKRHFQLAQEDAEPIVQFLASRFGFSGVPKSVKYLGGFEVLVPSEFLETQGHALHDLIRDAMPQLKRYPNLLTSIVDLAASDVPAYIPKPLLDAFVALARN
ncbi:AAA family ATPase [Microlunatus sp. GCM10028923]|uniref:AAA family ATPase n=1 Tax=Microlunatus sp. GCM10028923 TaxID=3273400 RepID=UPI00361C5187